MGSRSALVIAIAFLGITAAPGAGQRAALPPPPSPDTLTITPGGAFVRSLLIPGWGHARAGSYTRAGFYVAAQGGTLWMLAKTQSRRRTALDLVEMKTREAASQFRAEGIAADSAAFLAEQAPAVVEARALVESRSRQREDWLALGIFLVFLSGVDAYVSTHLADFPEPLTLSVGSVGMGAPARAEISLRIPWEGPGFRRER